MECQCAYWGLLNSWYANSESSQLASLCWYFDDTEYVQTTSMQACVSLAASVWVRLELQYFMFCKATRIMNPSSEVGCGRGVSVVVVGEGIEQRNLSVHLGDGAGGRGALLDGSHRSPVIGGVEWWRWWCVGGGDMWRVDGRAIPNPPTQGLAFMVHAAWCLIISQPRLCRFCGSHQPQGMEGPFVVALPSSSMAEPTRTPHFQDGVPQHSPQAMWSHAPFI